MGRIEASPPTILPPRVVRLRTRGHEPSAEPHLPGSTEPALPITPQRLELIKACAQNSLRADEGLATSRIAERFAPRANQVSPLPDHRSYGSPLASLSALASGIRTLTLVLIVAALLPNLTLAALWLRLIDLPWTESGVRTASAAPPPALQAAMVPPVLSAPEAIAAPAGDTVILPVALDGTDGVPAGSRIIISGLPQGSALSNGQRQGDAAWSLKPDEIGDLHLALPDAPGEAKLNIALVAPGDRLMADASTTLQVAAVGAEAEPQSVAAIQAGAEETRAIPAAAPADADVMPLPTRRPPPPGAEDDRADWIKPSAYVNLRTGPSSSAAVVGVVAKGTKLRVMGRKRGWVQVSNPATSNSGWIYSGKVATLR